MGKTKQSLLENEIASCILRADKIPLNSFLTVGENNGFDQ